MELLRMLLLAEAPVELRKVVALRTAVVLDVVDQTVKLLKTGDAPSDQLED